MMAGVSSLETEMGFSISWLAFKALNKNEVLKRTGFWDTGVKDEANQSPFSLAELPTGWTILFSNDFDYGSAEHLIGLSAGAVVVACQAEEHIMFSAAHCCADGRESWSVWHDSGRGLYDLSTRGALPAEFAPIRRRLAAKQDESGGARSDVDYTFDVPVELARELTGYRHDFSKFDWGQPHFAKLERSR
jgi:hypothetical protein